MADWTLAWRLARREMRGGLAGFRIFLICIAVGVAAIAAVHSLSGAIGAGLARDARVLLGGDIVVRTTYRPVGGETRARLEELGRVSETVEMRAMARSGESAGLVELKAVDAAYPLAGTVRLSNGLALGEAFQGLGAVAEPTLLDRLGLEVGDTVAVGEAQYTIRATIEREPDRTVGLFTFGPRLMVDRKGLRASGLVRPGSLIRYHYRILLDRPADSGGILADLREEGLERNWRVRGLDGAAPGLRRTITRLTLFMTLVGLAALTVGGIGVANAVRAHLAAKRATIATLGCLGATPAFILKLFGLQIAVMAGLATAIGVGIGASVPLALQGVLAELLPVDPEFGVYPRALLMAASFGALAAALFAAWPLAAAARTAPVALFRDVRGRARAGRGAGFAVAGLAAALAALTILTAPDPRFAAWFVAGTLVTFALFAASARATVGLARAFRGAGPGALRRALAGLARPGGETAGLLLSLGFGVTVMVAIATVEDGFADQLRDRLPRDAPSHFFIDIQPGQVAEFEDIVEADPEARLDQIMAHLRARIVALNGTRADRAEVAPQARWGLNDELGISHAAAAPDGTEIVAGTWWPSDHNGRPRISFDAQLAAGFGLGVGDRITFNILGREVDAEIANLRRISWDNLRMQFTTIFAPGALEGAPQTFIATVRADPDAEARLTAGMAKALPNVSAIRVKDALDRAAELLFRIGLAVRAVAAVGLAAGLAVLAGAIAAGRRRRERDAVIFKVLGATRRDLARSYLVEFLILGAVAAAIGSALGLAAGFVLLEEVMGLAWTAPLRPALATAATAVALTALFGFVGTWRVLGRPAASALRQAER